MDAAQQSLRVQMRLYRQSKGAVLAAPFGVLCYSVLILARDRHLITNANDIARHLNNHSPERVRRQNECAARTSAPPEQGQLRRRLQRS